MLDKLTPLFLGLLLLAGCQSPAAEAPQAPAPSSPPEAPQAPPTPEVSLEDSLAKGRELLDQRRPNEALPYFEAALELQPDSFEARLWQLRAWMDQGRSNDTLDAIDELRRAGKQGPDIEYLYGMAFLRRAQGMLSAGVTDSSPRMNFEDAAFRLEKVLRSQPERYPDAYQALSVASWFNLNLERARWASELAVEQDPWSARAWLQLGRVAMSQFSGELSNAGGSEWSEAAREHHARALEAFVKASEALGAPVDDSAEQRLLSDAGIQLGHAYIWAGKQQEAMGAYVQGIAWSPEAVNYGQLQGLLASRESPAPRPDLFHRALEEGAAIFERNFGSEDPRNATLLWWLGWERLQAGQPVGSELAFLGSLRKNPTSANTYFYLALARFEARNFAGGAEALADGWKTDSNVIIDSVLADKDSNLWIVGQALSNLVDGPAFLDADTNRQAAMLARVMSEADPYDGWNWNNLGMFRRDQADASRFAGLLELGDPELAELYEGSYAAYQRSLALLPDDAGVVNDTAVLLHYYLERDTEKALAMYKRATQLAEAALEDEELSKSERKRLETALKDSIDNHRKLLEIQAKAAEEATANSMP